MEVARALPLALVGRAADAVLFRTPAGPVTAAAVLAAAGRAAARLPPGTAPAANLCEDRLAFTVALAACALAGRTCLLPNDASAPGLTALAAHHPGAILLHDDPDLAPAPLPRHRIMVDTDAGIVPAPSPMLPADRLVAIGFTSGSTGAPAAHGKRWGALVARSAAAAAAFGFAGDPWTLVGTVPARHMYGFETTVLLPLHTAVSSWCGPHFFPEDVRRALAAVPRPRALVTTPLHLRALLRSGLCLPPLELVISATAPLESALAAAAEAAWGAPVHEIFGATEVGSIAHRRTVLGPDWHPYPGVELHPAGAATEVRAPGAPPHALADQLELRMDGTFRLLGRSGDLVKLGGRRASLAELNRLLLTLPGVEDGAFLAPDAVDARLIAFAVAPGLSAAELLAGLRARLEAPFVPRRLHLLEALPRDALGKLPRAALLRLHAEAEAGAVATVGR